LKALRRRVLRLVATPSHLVTLATLSGKAMNRHQKSAVLKRVGTLKAADGIIAIARRILALCVSGDEPSPT
jgi:hypothetical protein